jgi:transcription termination factor Rho
VDTGSLGRGFQILAEGLAPFVDQRMRAAHPEGDGWLSALQARDRARFGRARPVSLNDPALLLRVLWAQWHLFDGALPVVARAYAGELREVRNRWAHNDALAEAEIRHAFGTMELLLRQVGAHDLADAVASLHAVGEPTPDAPTVAVIVPGHSEAEPAPKESTNAAPEHPGSETAHAPIPPAVEELALEELPAAGLPAPEPPAFVITGLEESEYLALVQEDDILVPIAGVLDVLPNYAFVRTSGYQSGPHDVFVPLSAVVKHRLRKGDHVTGAVREPREGERRERFNTLVRLDTVYGVPPANSRDRPSFGHLTPLAPQERLYLETGREPLFTRVLDLFVPIGKGQRGLILAPPKAGRSTTLQHIAQGVVQNNPECHVMVVMVDEPAEAVTDMVRSVRRAEVVFSTADRSAEDHVATTGLAFERALRLVELGHDVVVLVDSLTRLAAAHNLITPASGRVLPGGLDAAAVHPVTSLFAAARNIEDGGSLTIVGTALVETGSVLDQTIAEELRRLATMQLHLDRRLADRRIFPALDLHDSGTKNEHLLMGIQEAVLIGRVRDSVRAMEPQHAIETLTRRLSGTRTNAEFLMSVAQES